MFKKEDRGSFLSIGRFLELKHSEEGQNYERYGLMSIISDVMAVLFVYLYLSVSNVMSPLSCFSSLDTTYAGDLKTFFLLVIVFFGIFSLITMIFQNALNGRSIGKKAMAAMAFGIIISVILSFIMG